MEAKICPQQANLGRCCHEALSQQNTLRVLPRGVHEVPRDGKQTELPTGEGSMIRAWLKMVSQSAPH